jgi:hypothetical protein
MTLSGQATTHDPYSEFVATPRLGPCRPCWPGGASPAP